MTLFWVALGWIAGLGLAALAPVPAAPLVGLAVAGAALAGGWWPHLGRRQLGLAVVAVALAALRWSGDAAPAAAGPGALASYQGQVVEITGWVSAEPVELVRHTRLQVTVESVAVRPAAAGLAAGAAGTVAASAVPATGDVLATVLNGVPHRYGERLALTGDLSAPPVFDGFDYRDYLARQGIGSLLRFPRVRRLPGQSGEAWRAWLFEAKHAVRAALERHVAEPEAGLLIGVLLGSRTAMPGWLLDAFSATNTTHMIAISGWNISLVAGWAMPLALLMTGRRRLPALSVVAAVILLYTLFVGATPSVVRAALMGGVALLGGAVGRPRSSLPALAFAALAMTVWQPALILDTGFQLSCLATLGIVLYADRLARLLARPGLTLGRRRLALPAWLAAMLSVTLAAELTTTPLLAFEFHRLSLVGLLANLALDWTMAPITALGGLTALLGLVPWFGPLATVAGWGAWLFAAVLTHGVAWFAGLPLATLDIGDLDGRCLVGWYGTLAAATALAEPAPRAALAARLGRLSPAPTGLAVWSGGWCVALALLVAAPPAPAPARLLFLQLGRGDVLLARSAVGATVLIDGGSTPSEAVGALGRRLPFWARRVDLLVATASAPNQLTGLPEVVRRYDVGLALLPPGDLSLVAARQLRDALRDRSTPTLDTQPGLTVPLPGGQLTALASTAQPAARRSPASALQSADSGAISAWRLELGGVSALLVDDLSPEAQTALLHSDGPLRADVLRLPATGALSPELLAAIAPRAIVFESATGQRAAASNPLTDLPPDWLAGIEIWDAGPDGPIEAVADGAALQLRRLH